MLVNLWELNQSSKRIEKLRAMFQTTAQAVLVHRFVLTLGTGGKEREGGDNT